MRSNKELLKYAEQYLGQGGSRFRKFCGLPSGAAWCNAFVSYIFIEGGDGKLYCDGKKQTYCPTSVKWCQKNLAQIPMYLAMPMDVIYFDWDRNNVPNHIGFVRAHKSTSEVKTIEGNTGNKVAYKTRPKKYVMGIYRPHFEGTYKEGQPLHIDGVMGYNTIAGLKLMLKRLGHYNGAINTILDIETVKALQKWAGAKADGAWGDATSKKVQAKICATQDGDFGPNSVKNLQKIINGTVYQSVPETPSEPKLEPYKGTFPTPNNNTKIVNGLAYQCCYPYGTPSKKYKYSTGKPKPFYKKALDKAYPKHMQWKNAKQRVGACCDILPGTILNLVGIECPKHLKDQCKVLPKAKGLKDNGHHTASQFKLGDVVQRLKANQHGHTWVVCELINGQKYVANSHYRKLNGCYAVMDSKPKTVNPKKYAIYHCYTVEGAIRTDYQKDDYGYDVLYIQRFLNWYGIKVTEDGDFGDNTEAAVKVFQEQMGLTIDGKVGSKTIEAMKAVRR